MVCNFSGFSCGRLAVRDEAYARETIALNRVRREQMHAAIAALGIHSIHPRPIFFFCAYPVQ